MRIVAICMHAHAMHALRNMHAPLSFLIKGLLCRAWPFQSTGYENMCQDGVRVEPLKATAARSCSA